MPTHLQTVVGTTAAATNTVSVSITTGAGTDVTLIAVVSWRDDTGSTPSCSTVAFNGTEGFTLGREYQLNYAGDNYLTVSVWYLDGPSPSTTANVVATLSESVDVNDGIGIAVSEYSDANNGIGPNTGVGSANSQFPSCSITTTTTDGLVVGGLSAGDPTLTMSWSAPAVERSDYNAGTGGVTGSSAEEAATGGAVTFDGTLSSGNRWALACIELLAAPAATRDIRPPAMYNDLALY